MPGDLDAPGALNHGHSVAEGSCTKDDCGERNPRDRHGTFNVVWTSDGRPLDRWERDVGQVREHAVFVAGKVEPGTGVAPRGGRHRGRGK